ncbi:AAA family ATPase [Ramlibacter sp. RBP-2]|uniref:AAA family ATPase n=1 Tax=Ramlibacter lithotrophicus TaxID=2606681 RepID=A0A7X6I5G7_9BURK|nr:AAA family ATPase [Ramlibacter lithotrophicus]NKE65049.1 AAA family ATPase [Ramlibacter lithotrophicus]
MYAAYFGLAHEPFSIAPDPRYLYMSERHREALAHLLYGLGAGGGFVLLSGEIGTGKTTVCRLFLEQVPADCNVAYIFNPKLTVIELLQSVCEEFHIAVPPADHAPTVKDYLDPLNDFLLREHAAGRNNVLIIDEAQNLSAEVLEQLRLLTNLETSERKLLQIILIGQPELRSMLARPELEQLAQRVIARYHLDAMTAPETAHYIQHRLEVAGLQRPLPFDRRALRRIHELARGVPRRVNLLCDRALLGAFAGGQPAADRRTVEKAAAEVFGDAPRTVARWPRAAVVLGLGVAAGAGLYAAASRWLEPATLQPVAIQAPGPANAATPAEPPAAAASLAAPAAIAPAPAASAPQPTLLHEADQAWRELAQVWKLPVPQQGDPCDVLRKEGVQCFSRTLSLPVIRELGRPGILTLDAATGSPRYALLTGLTRDSATLQAGGTEQTVTLTALAQRWQGGFATLWRSPPGYSGRSDHPETVAWMAAGLAKATGAPAPTGTVTLDAVLRARLRTFQTAQGLAADGQPGPMTFMQLNRAAGVDEPRLHSGS